jgi:glycosidase
MITQDDVIYFIVTDRFFPIRDSSNPLKMHGGNFDGLVEKAPYIKALGFTAVWITPVYVNAGVGDTDPYHYYWAVDFHQVDQRLYTPKPGYAEGDKRYLRDVVDALHAQGLKVILDVVVNHCGYSGRDRFPADWFNPDYQGQGDPVTKEALAGLPDFNHDHPNVADFFVQNLLDWVSSTGIDAIRMDTAKHVEPRFWHAFKAQLKGRYPDVTLIGEVLYQDKSEIPHISRFQRDYDFDSMFDFPLATELRNTLVYDQSMQRLARPRLHPHEEKGVLDMDNPDHGGYTNANRLVTLLDNHDLEKRIISHARSKHPGEAGKPVAHRVTRLCLSALFTVRGIPSIYYGTELGLEGWKNGDHDVDLRRPFPWALIDPQTHAPRDPQSLEGQLYYHLKDLISLYRSNPALRYGDMHTLWSDRFVYAFIRFFNDHVAIVIINNGYGDMEHDLSIVIARKNQKLQQLLPDRIIDLLEQRDLVEYRNPQDRVRLRNQFLNVRVPGKTAKIYTF